VRYTDPDGRERGRSFDRKQAAENFRSTTAADLLRGTYLDPDAGKITLRRYARDWLEGWHEDSGRAEHIRWQLDHHILPVLGGATLARLASRPTLIQQWVAGLALASSSAEGVFVTLSQILSAAVDDGRIPKNPCQAKSIRRPRAGPRKVVPWTAAEVAAVRSELPGRYRVAADCGEGLGMRCSEIMALGPDEIDFLRRNVHVGRQIKRQGGRLWFSKPKGRKERDVPLPQRTSMALSAHIAEFGTADITLPWHEPGDRRHGKPVTFPLLFRTIRESRAVSESTFNSATWGPARRRAGVTHGPYLDGPHALRHYYASVLLAGGPDLPGVDIRTLSEYLGHHDPAITLRIYAHLLPSAEQRVLKIIDAVLGTEPTGPSTAQTGPAEPSQGA
jgi:integrase